MVVALAVAYLLEVWFETKAFIEYCRQFGVKSWYVSEYLEGICDHLSYPEFLAEHHVERPFVKRRRQPPEQALARREGERGSDK